MALNTYKVENSVYPVSGGAYPAALSSVAMIDSYEDADFSEYQHTADGGKTPYTFDTANPIDGSYTVYLDDTGFPKVMSTPTGTDDLSNYPGQGDRFVVWMYNSIGGANASSMHFGFYFAADSSDPFNNCYFIRNRVDNSYIRIDKYSTTNTDTSFASINHGAAAGWNKLIIEWDDGSTFGGAQGDMTLIVEDDAGNVQGSATGNDTEFQGSAGSTPASGVWGGNEAGEYCMWDYAHITNR